MRPEQIKILGTYADGGVAVIAFVTTSLTPDGRVHWKRPATPANISAECAKISAVVPSPIVSWRIIADTEVPLDREYRNAWIDTGSSIGHDMTKARELHRNKLRVARAERFKQLDVEYQKADERADKKDKAAIAATKQRLRDAPADPRIDAAQTIEQLRAITLDP